MVGLALTLTLTLNLSLTLAVFASCSVPPVAQKRHAARQGLTKAGSFITAGPAAAAPAAAAAAAAAASSAASGHGHGQSAVAGGGRSREAILAPAEASELDAQLGSLGEVGRCSLTLPLTPALTLPMEPCAARYPTDPTASLPLPLTCTRSLTSNQVGRCSLGVGMGRATWTKAAADRSANIMEGVPEPTLT